MLFNFTINFPKQIYRFYKDSQLFINFLDKITFETEISDEKKTYWFVITPWMFTAVPWYSIFIAILIKKKGHDVKLLFDDLEFDHLSLDLIKASKVQQYFICKSLKKLNKHFEIRTLSKYKNIKCDKLDLIELTRLSKINSIHRFKSCILDDEKMRYSKNWVALQERNSEKIKSFFKSENVSQLVFPGGVYGNSGMYYHFLNNKKNAITFDSGLNRTLLCVNGITGYQADVPVCIKDEIFVNLSNKDFDLIEEIAISELNQRKFGEDFYSTQVVPYDDSNKFDFDIVIPLNITWDLPALGKHVLFENDFDWVIETVKYILENTSAKVAVRQHPHERRHSSGLDFYYKISKIFSENNRFRFFKCDEDLNTYSLINSCKIVLPYVSTIGIEAALMNKKVIMESDSYYSNYSFVEKATTKNDYFLKIKNCLNADFKLSKSEYKNAIVCYYITQMCTAESTFFTPHPENFRDWSLKDPNELLKNESVIKITKAISDKTPLAIINHINHMMKNE